MLMNILQTIKIKWDDFWLCPQCKREKLHWLNLPLEGKAMMDYIEHLKKEQQIAHENRVEPMFFDNYSIKLDDAIPKL